MGGVRDLIADLLSPSEREEPGSVFLARGIAHAALGGAAVEILGAWAWLFAVAYLVIKELCLDWIGKRGSLADGLADAGFVALGVAVVSPVCWVGTAFVAAAAREWMR